MSTDSGGMSGYLPDGRGLADEALAIINEHGGRIHLRLTNLDTGAARGACGRGIGEWWSGRADEVNCTGCLELVHS